MMNLFQKGSQNPTKKMISTIDMQHMRYINLFERVAGIRTRFCFVYNEAIYFCVPRNLVSKAIGKDAFNIKKLNHILNKRIRVIAYPDGLEDLRFFVQSIVNPVIFKDIGVVNDEVVLNASMQSKAALIGRNKRRLLEMQKIIKDFFGKEFRIV